MAFMLHRKDVFLRSFNLQKKNIMVATLPSCISAFSYQKIANYFTISSCKCDGNKSNRSFIRKHDSWKKQYKYNTWYNSLSTLSQKKCTNTFVGSKYIKRHSVNKTIFDASPNSVKPYLDLIRFDKPIGTWLLYLPCTWSIAMAANDGSLPSLKMLVLFGTGAFIMRGAGCVINDMWDSDFDKKVTRTVSRPLASGELTHMQALVYLAGLLSCGLGVLLSLNWYSVFLGGASMALVVSYPLMKRFTYWPQLFLGLALNWGAVLGWCAVRGSCDWSICVPLYVAGVSWTIIYDSIYAHQDKDDDQLIGVKSTALLFGNNTKLWLSGFAATMATSLCLSGYFSAQLWPYYLSVAGVSSHLAWQISTVNLSDSSDCFSKFHSNQFLGFLLFCGIVGSTLLKKSNVEKTE